MAHELLNERLVTPNKLIGVRHVNAGGRTIPVLLFNDGRSVSAHCLLDDEDTPILDGESPEAVLALVAEVIDDLLLARSRGRAA